MSENSVTLYRHPKLKEVVHYISDLIKEKRISEIPSHLRLLFKGNLVYDSFNVNGDITIGEPFCLLKPQIYTVGQFDGNAKTVMTEFYKNCGYSEDANFEQKIPALIKAAKGTHVRFSL